MGNCRSKVAGAAGIGFSVFILSAKKCGKTASKGLELPLPDETLLVGFDSSFRVLN